MGVDVGVDVGVGVGVGVVGIANGGSGGIFMEGGGKGERWAGKLGWDWMSGGVFGGLWVS